MSSRRRQGTADVQVQAWCSLCKSLCAFDLPLPPVTVRRVPLTLEPWAHPTPPIPDRAAEVLMITLREGHCADCGSPISRVGGSREMDGEPRESVEVVTGQETML
jgi:hypothetical protein